MSNIVSIAPKRPARNSTKLRIAIQRRVEEGLSIADACEKAGMSRQGWHKAMTRPEVRDLLADVQRQFIAASEGKRTYRRALADLPP